MTLAGSTRVLRLTEVLGNALANRVIGGKVHANVIGAFDPLKIAEAPVNGTKLIGKTLRESALREQTGVTVVGIWERGVFHMPDIDARLGNATVLVLAGSEEQFHRYEERFHRAGTDEAYVLILGGGRVGRSVADVLNHRDIPHAIVEKNPLVARETSPYVVGSAADLDTLTKAGIGRATTVIITTQDDNTNIYLTIYCRRLRRDVHIVSRATLERNISTLHRAGADAVLSYASLGSNAIMHFLKADRVMMLAEGLDITRIPLPRRLSGSTLRSSGIRARTGCSVIALYSGDETIVNPDPNMRLSSDMEMLLVGRIDAINTFLSEYHITISDSPGTGQ
jgi:Trk K+ transport system NAD-binding subunit